MRDPRHYDRRLSAVSGPADLPSARRDPPRPDITAAQSTFCGLGGGAGWPFPETLSRPLSTLLDGPPGGRSRRLRSGLTWTNDPETGGSG